MTSPSGQQASTTTTSGPPPQVLQAYQNVNDAATNLASQPIPQYNAPLVAGFTPSQQQAFQTVDNAQGIGLPYINSAAQEFGQATTPLWQGLPQFDTSSLPSNWQQDIGTATGMSTGPGYAQSIQNYSNPYTQNVTNALQSLYSQQNAQQQAQIQGNATSHGAYGGDREAVAQALAAQQENLAQAPTLAQVQQQGYQQAQQETNQQQQTLAGLGQQQIGEFNTQQQQQLAADQANAWLSSQAGFGLAGLGSQAQNEALTGAGSQLQTGGLQQQLAQEQLNIPYQQYAQQIASPYQQLNFLAGITEGTGSLSGGTGTTTPPAPSTLGQIAGLGVAGLGVAGLGNQLGFFGSTPTASQIYAGGQLGTANWARGGRIQGNLQSSGVIAGADGQGISSTHEHRAAGGIGGPAVGGIGVPDPSMDFIPQPPAIRGGGSGPVGNNVTQTTTGAGSTGSDVGTAISVASAAAKFIPMLFAARGGRIGYDSGGGIGLPTVPTIDFDKLITPGPVVKGSGPPAPPKAQASSDPTLAQDITGVGNALKSTKSSSSGSDDSSSGRLDYDVGGSTPIQALNPNAQAMFSQYSNMSAEQLQELAVRVPPTTPQGQLVQRALQQKRMNPQPPAPAPTASSDSSGIGAPGLGAPTQQPQQPLPGGTSHLATGGEPNYVTADEIDPHPIVDHSGDTVKIRYPSEGNKVLDLGLPSIKGIDHRMLAAGGSSGSSPQTSTSFTAANGVQIPLLGTSTFAGPGKQGNPAANPGEGLGQWLNPLPLYRPPGTGVGPNGSLAFPTTPGAMSAFGVPGAAASSPTSSAGSVGGGDPSVINGTLVIPDPGGTGGGGKRGGNVSHFDDGGDVAAEGRAEAAAYEMPAKADTYLADVGAETSPWSLPDIGFGQPPGNYTPYSPKGPDVVGGTDPGTALVKALGPVAAGVGGPKVDMPKEGPSTYEPPLTVTAAPAKALLEPASSSSTTGRFGSGIAPDFDKAQPSPAVPATTDDSGLRVGLGTPSPPEPVSGGIGVSADLAGSRNFPRLNMPALQRGAEPGGIGTEGGIGAATAEPVTSKTPPVFFGDSIANGIRGAAGAGGVTHDGWHPDQVLGAFTGADIKGAPAYISSGVSNDFDPKNPNPADPMKRIGMVNDQIKSAWAAGAGAVNLYGVGTGVPGYKAVNERLAEIAASNGANFIPLTGTEGGRIHPRDYNEAWQASGRDQVTPTSGGQSGPPPMNTDRWTPTFRQIVDTAQGLQATPVALHAMTAAALGEGNLNDPWAQSSVVDARGPGGREASWGPWQLHQGGELDRYLSEGNKPGDVQAQTSYVAKRADEISNQHGWGNFTDLTDTNKAIQVMSEFENSKQGPAYYASNLPLAGSIIGGAPIPQGSGRGSFGTRQALPPLSGDPVVAGGAGGIGPGGLGSQTNVNAAIDKVAATAPTDSRGNKNWTQSPWFPVLAAGLGMLASRSPYAGVAIGEGGLQGIKAAENVAGLENRQEIAGIRAQHLNEMADVRNTAAQNKLTSDAANLQFKYDNLKRLQDAGNQSIELRTQMAAAGQQLNEAKLKLAEVESDRKRAADNAKTAKPVAGFDIDPTSGKTVYGTHTYDPDQGKYVFTPGAGVGHPTVATGELGVLQRMMDQPDGPKTLQEAMQLQAQAKQSPQVKQRFDLAIEAEARNQAALEERAFSANPTNVGKPFNVQGAEQRHLQDLRTKMYGAAAPTAAPASPVAAPAPAAAAPQIARPPTVPEGSAYSPSRHIWRDPAGKLYSDQGVPAQ